MITLTMQPRDYPTRRPRGSPRISIPAVGQGALLFLFFWPSPWRCYEGLPACPPAMDNYLTGIHKTYFAPNVPNYKDNAQKAPKQADIMHIRCLS
jgi:hypothetical protein